MEKWTKLKKWLYSLSEANKESLKKKINKLITENRIYVDNILLKYREKQISNCKHAQPSESACFIKSNDQSLHKDIPISKITNRMRKQLKAQALLDKKTQKDIDNKTQKAIDKKTQKDINNKTQKDIDKKTQKNIDKKNIKKKKSTSIKSVSTRMKIGNGMLKQSPHLFIKYMHFINKFYEDSRPEITEKYTNKVDDKQKYMADSRRGNTKRTVSNKSTKNISNKIKKKDVELDDEEDFLDKNDFSMFTECKKFMRCRNLLPIRTGLPCFITISSGDRLKNIIKYHYSKYKIALIRTTYIPKNKNEIDILKLVQKIDDNAKTLMKDMNEANYDTNLMALNGSIDVMKKCVTIIIKSKIKTDITKKIRSMYERINSIDNDGELLDYLSSSWLFVKNKRKYTLNMKNQICNSDVWWKSIFNLEKQFPKLTYKYMLSKKSYLKTENVYDILGNYITTDGYQLKIQLIKLAINDAVNVNRLYEKNYDSVKCGDMTNTLITRGIFDINDVKLKDKQELYGRIIKGVDPGITNIISWTEAEIDDSMKINSEHLKGTDKEVTNGEYHCSWFKGPHRILEQKWRDEHDINILFEDLSLTSLRTSYKKNILGYLKILFQKNNYTKMKKYKYDERRQKWRYKRLLGKRSYIDKMTNDLAYGIPLKKYGRGRKRFKSTINKPSIVIFGAANYKTSMRNYCAVPKKSILRVLAQKTIVMLINEANTTKKCFKCKENLHAVTDIHKKNIGDRFFSEWTKSNLRNVRYCQNKSCIKKDRNRFYIGRDVNASNNMLINGLQHLSGESNLEHITDEPLGDNRLS
jgi:hypothetical protein